MMKMNYLINNMPGTWDYNAWLKDFRKASSRDNGHRELRKLVFQSTVGIVREGNYWTDDHQVIFKSQDDLPGSTIFYNTTTDLKSDKNIAGLENTGISCLNADCLEVGQLLLAMKLNPAVLNMASRQNPGGGVYNGAGAQEENIFRRSNLFRSLYQFVDYSDQYWISRNKQFSYPLDRESAGIYSSGVTIFRSSENTGYRLLEDPYKLSFITVPAINSPDMYYDENRIPWIVEGLVEPTRVKIRTILRIGSVNGHDSLVLSAFGCGAFKNPPNHVAMLFKEVLMEDEFKDRFKVIVFAIIDDHNAWKEHNPEGNLIPFQRVFSGI